MAEIESLDAPGHSFKRTLKDLFAGAAGGVAQVLTGLCLYILWSSFQYSKRAQFKKSPISSIDKESFWKLIYPLPKAFFLP